MVTSVHPPDAVRGYSIVSAAERLDTSPAALRMAVRRGHVRAARIGQKYLILETEIERLLMPIRLAGREHVGV